MTQEAIKQESRNRYDDIVQDDFVEGATWARDLVYEHFRTINEQP